jgi:hypothetical protein
MQKCKQSWLCQHRMGMNTLHREIPSIDNLGNVLLSSFQSHLCIS